MSEQQLIVIERKDALTTFSTLDGLDPILARARKEVDDFLGKGVTVSTKKGRDEIRSFAMKVVQSKTYLDNVGKALVDELKDVPKKVDASRRRVRDTLDQWRDEVRAPLTKWEVDEDVRIETHKAAIGRMTSLAEFPPSISAADLRQTISVYQAVEIGPVCEEFEAEYAVAKDQCLRALNSALAARELHEQEQAELARLRAAEAEREAQRQKEAEAAAAIERERLRKEREAAIASEAAERARLKAEADAKREREGIENEARVQREAAERSARQEREIAARREQALRDEAAAAERRAAEAEAKAKRELEEAAAAEAAETARREKNKRHAAAVNCKAIEAFVSGGIPEELAKLAVTLIAKRQIPAVSISY